MAGLDLGLPSLGGTSPSCPRGQAIAGDFPGCGGICSAIALEVDDLEPAMVSRAASPGDHALTTAAHSVRGATGKRNMAPSGVTAGGIGWGSTPDGFPGLSLEGSHQLSTGRG